MKKPPPLLCLYALALLPVAAMGRSVTTSPVEKISAEDKLEAKLDQYLTKVTSESGFSGAVLVARGNKILLHQGYGWADRKKTSKVASDTKFYIASITKQFTAAAILLLEERGKLSVKDTIAIYFKDAPTDKAGITLHQLLTHTSGFGQNYAADGVVDRDEAVRAILKQPLKSLPGERFGYANDGYNLLAIIVEIASGQTYESFLRQLLKPAGMSQTGFWGEPAARGEQPLAQTLTEIDTRPSWGFRGATGMFSTVRDLYKWQQALFANKILKDISKRRVLSPYASTSRGMYGYGWFVSKTKEGREIIWTAGAEDFGHNAIIKTYTDGTVIVVASNAGNISNVPARSLVSDELERIVFETGW